MDNADMPDAHRKMSEITVGLPTKSAKIRALDDAGYSRSEIAKFMGIRYQHVRNVLVAPKPKGERGLSEPSAPWVAGHPPPMEEIVVGMKTKAEKIRALAREGHERAEIARFLGVRYQHVYNVLKQSEAAEAPATAGTDAAQQWVKVGPGGGVVIPTAFLQALGVKEGSEVQLRLEEDEVTIVPRSTVIRRVQERVRKYVPEGVSLVDELIAERRREAEREERGG